MTQHILAVSVFARIPGSLRFDCLKNMKLRLLWSKWVASLPICCHNSKVCIVVEAAQFSKLLKQCRLVTSVIVILGYYTPESFNEASLDGLYNGYMLDRKTIEWWFRVNLTFTSMSVFSYDSSNDHWKLIWSTDNEWASQPWSLHALPIHRHISSGLACRPSW